MVTNNERASMSSLRLQAARLLNRGNNMKSVFKFVAPMTVALSVALSGVAMATAAPAAKSTDISTAAKVEKAEKPVVQSHKHLAEKKDAAKTEAVKAAPVETATTTSAAVTEKVAPAADAKKTVEPAKIKQG